MANVAPQLKLRKLIVVMAFNRRKGGKLEMVRVPQLFDTEERAVRKAEELATDHAGVIAWSREANPDLGDYGPPKTLFVDGEVPSVQ
jgi:hypothetical protein